MRRREFTIALVTAAGALPLIARAQQSAMPVIGFLCSLSSSAVAGPVAAFRQGLQAIGYEEGKSVAIDFRWAEGHYEKLPSQAADLVGRRVAVIVTVGGDPPALAAKAATTTIPTVFMVGSDPVSLGLVASLSRPGGNATGVNLLVAEMESKRLALLRQIAPTATVFGVIVNPKNQDSKEQLHDLQSTARSLGIEIVILNASDDTDLENVFATFEQKKIAGFMVVADPFYVNRRDRIISFATQHAIPAVYFLREFAVSGGLMSYGTSLADAYRQVGIYAGKIFQGTKPDELPVVQPTKYELVINLKAAERVGLRISPNLLALADDVIE